MQAAGRRIEGADVLDAKVISEVAHEVRNHFHKLYYCAELVRSAAGTETEGDLGIAAGMLERTVHVLEQVTNTALEYVRPLVIEPVVMGVADLARAVAAVLRSEDGREAALDVDPDAAERRVRVDPSRFSFALRTIAERLAESAGGGAAPVRVRVGRSRRGADDVVDVAIAVRDPAAPAGGAPRSRAVDWALVERILAAHGGGIDRGEQGEPDFGCTLWLPVEGGDGAVPS